MFHFAAGGEEIEERRKMKLKATIRLVQDASLKGALRAHNGLRLKRMHPLNVLSFRSCAIPSKQNVCLAFREISSLFFLHQLGCQPPQRPPLPPSYHVKVSTQATHFINTGSQPKESCENTRHVEQRANDRKSNHTLIVASPPGKPEYRRMED